MLTSFALGVLLVSASAPGITRVPEYRIATKKCPAVEVKGPSKSKALKTVSYRAKVKGFSGETPPLFKWSVIGGVLIQGQGSAAITVEPQAREVRATLVVENLPADCRSNGDTVVTKITDIPWIHPPPVISSIKTLPSIIVRPCPGGTRSETCAATTDEVQLTVDATAPVFGTILVTWSVPVGRLKGEGNTVIWDLSGVASGAYDASVEVEYVGYDHKVAGSATVKVTDCECKQLSVTDAAKPSSHLLPQRATSLARLHSTGTLR